MPSEPLAPHQRRTAPDASSADGPHASSEPGPDADPLIIGPVLRRVSDRAATVWVQTARAGVVRVRCGDVVAESRTFCVHGLHFALVIADGLGPGTTSEYRVDVNGRQAWPPDDYAYPAPVIRTRRDGDDRPVRIAFGSCREAGPAHVDGLEPDALDAYAVRLATDPDVPRPDLLMLLGDQVYADVTSKSTRAWLRRHRGGRRPAGAPPKQVVTFAEYARLYRESWSDPDVRWLLSTVPTVLIFDDHEIIDDWNTSASWRREIRELEWWPERIAAGLGSYWVFQHAGNINPADLPDDPTYRSIMAMSGADAADVLRQFAVAADAASDAAATDEPAPHVDAAGAAAGALAEAMASIGNAATGSWERPSHLSSRPTAVVEPSGAYRWSYQFDIGRTKVVVLDSRCGRVLAPGRRAMVSPIEWAWFANAVTDPYDDYDHLVIGASLPWLMPFGIHDLEAASERWAESRNGALAAWGEWLRRALDLEHWPAFGASFDDLAATLAEIGRGGAGRARPQVSISVLSGDVHHSYVARAAYGSDVVTPVHQLTCSPVHNRVPSAIKPLMRSAWHRRGKRIGRVLARRAGAMRPLVSWRKLAGPYFGNAISTLHLDRSSARVTIERTDADQRLVALGTTQLAGRQIHPGPVG